MRFKHLTFKLKPLNAVIQICGCGKVDAYKDDGHNCEDYLIRRAMEDCSYK